MSTTIRINRETKKLLEEIGHKGETFDMIVRAGALELSNKNHMYITNSPVITPNGVEYVEIRVPKHIKEITETNVLGRTLKDSLHSLCNEHDIKI